MKKITFLLLVLLCLDQTHAQQKLFNIEEVVLKQRTTLAPERLSQLQWIPNTNQFSYVGKKNNLEILITQNAESLKRDTVLVLADFNTALQNLLPQEKALNRFPFITWVTKASFRVFYQNAYYIFTFNDMRLRLIASAPKDAENLDFNPTSNKLAYTLNYNLFVNTAPGAFEEGINSNGDAINKKDLITSDGNINMQYGSSNVHRNEFGITKGTFFSAQGNKIAFYKLNEGMVSDYELMNIEVPDTLGSKLTKPTEFKRMKYPMAGNVSHQAKVMLYDFKRKQLIEVKTEGDAEQYLTNVTWSADEEYLFIAVLNRAQNEMSLNMYDGNTGVFIKTLFSESHQKYVEPEKGPYFINNDNSKFIWFSKRNGYNHIYLYTSRGTLLKQISVGNFHVNDIIGNDPTGNILYYHAYSEDGLNKYVYRYDFKTNSNTIINKLPGQHVGLISSDGKLILENLSSTEIPRRVLLMNDKGAEINIVFNAINPLRDYAACQTKLFTLTSPDAKTKLNARMILPHNFDATKKYPVIVYVYGGPRVQLISNTWLAGADMWFHYMAQQGYIIFTIDNRGSSNRGLEFENVVHRNLGKAEMEDQLAGVTFLKSLPYINANRLGVYGWSFGGFMSTSLMTKTPNIFKVGVAGGPVIDWRFYEIMYTERYMDKPQENAQGYAEADLKNYTQNLTGKLLLVHGTNDNVVLWQHSLSYIKKCIDDGVLVDYFVYPGHEHNVMGKDRVHLMRKISTYFKDFL